MGYYASGEGTIKFKDETAEEIISNYIQKFKEIFECVECSKSEISFNGYDKFYSDEIEELLDEITPNTESGDIEYVGEDYALWRYHFDGTAFIEENGSVTYPSESEGEIREKISSNDKAEFVGQIIDIFEDFLDERGIILDNPERDDSDSIPEETANIYGSDYGELQDALEEIIGKWSGEEKKEPEITGLYIEPGKKPEIMTAKNLLESLQATIGGLIEPFRPFNDNVVILVNEEGKFNGMEPNRAIRDKDGDIMDIVFGPMFIISDGKEDFCSLDPDLLHKYEELFRYPEIFLNIGGKIIVQKVEEE